MSHHPQKKKFFRIIFAHEPRNAGIKKTQEKGELIRSLPAALNRAPAPARAKCSRLDPSTRSPRPLDPSTRSPRPLDPFAVATPRPVRHDPFASTPSATRSPRPVRHDPFATTRSPRPVRLDPFATTRSPSRPLGERVAVATHHTYLS
jgi:hypothetical protein